MTGHADTIRREISEGKRCRMVLCPRERVLLAERQQLQEGLHKLAGEHADLFLSWGQAAAERRQLQEERDEAQQKFRVECEDRRAAVAERDKAERERRQAIDALRRAELALRPHHPRLAAELAALVKLGEKP